MKHIQIIVNPSSGQDEPILQYINETLKNKVSWDISITHKSGDAKLLAEKAIQKKADIIAVYGGDGTVMEVAQTVYKTSIPLALLPGGTANIMVKELGIPTTTTEAIKLLLCEDYSVQAIDMLIANEKPYLLRASVGLLADMVKKADKNLKKQFGPFAYSITALNNLKEKDKSTYHMMLDGQEISVNGESLLIANAGHMGIAGLSVSPDIKVTDGLLDILLIRNIDLKTVFEIANSSLLQNKPPLKQWKAKELHLEVTPPQTITCDDDVLQTNTVHFRVAPKAINILVPSNT